jgi:tetratricopeptide (TPR) repeat protein
VKLLDRLLGKREADATFVNDPSVPLVSILIRSMDRKTLDRAMRSAARQTWGNIEIVVVAACGAAHRKLAGDCLGRPVQLVFGDERQRLSRPVAANVALASARGEWLNFLDDDDELDAVHVATLMQAMRSRREKFVYSATRVLDKRGATIARVGHPGNHVQLYFHSRSASPSMMIHRSLVDDGVRFDPAFEVHEDHDFQIACATRTAFFFVDAITTSWHGQIGESGCGFGPNDDHAQRVATVTRIRAKWEQPLDRWLRKFDDVLTVGKMYIDGGDIPAGLACLERALELRPSDVNALNFCGMANFEAGALDRAEELVARAVKRLPRQPALRDNLARIRARRAESFGP